MGNYLEKVNEFVFKIKSNVERAGFATPEVINQLLSLYLDTSQYSNKLEKQLDYALLNSGEYLEVDNFVN